MPEIEIPVERARIVLQLAVSAEPDGHEEHVEGLLDTGSTQSFISSDLINRIGAAPIGSVAVNSMELAGRTRSTYPVHVRVPAPQFLRCPVTGPLPQADRRRRRWRPLRRQTPRHTV